ncbi:MAG: hypothetical protein IJZ76_08540 [Lachnospiraceae bacterium]|nr:hypothetical protein [Lachnospiraceae bacterium]
MKTEMLAEKLKTLGKDRFVLLFLAGIMLVIIAVPIDKETKAEAGQEDVQQLQAENRDAAGMQSGSDNSATEEYREKLCLKLKEFLQNVDGAGKVEVYITMHSSAEIIVERNSPYSKRTEEEAGDGTTRKVGEMENQSEVVLAQQEDGSQAPIVVKEITPMVEGVVVAAQGGGNEKVKNEIAEVVMALFGIEEHKIKVVKLST